MRIFIILLVTSLILSCNETKTIYVGPHLVDCEGISEQKCMQVKENKQDDWTLFYDKIEGFEYEEGFTYKMEVNISKVKNPPADGSALKYKMTKLIYQEVMPKKVSQATNIKGEWKVSYINDVGDVNSTITMNFDAEKKTVSGTSACNNYGSSYTIEGDSISFGLARATKRMCTDMKIEKAFFTCLNQASSYKIVDNQLTFYNKENEKIMACSVKED